MRSSGSSPITWAKVGRIFRTEVDILYQSWYRIIFRTIQPHKTDKSAPSEEKSRKKAKKPLLTAPKGDFPNKQTVISSNGQ